MTAGYGVPEPSRLPVASGSSSATPFGAGRPGRLRADPGEHEGVLAAQEPVCPNAARAAALGGVLGVRRHLERAGLGAGQGVGGPGRGDDDVVGARGRPPRRRSTVAPGESRMPAIPPAARPCGRTADAGKRSSWASLVTKTRSSSPSRSAAAPDDAVAVAQRDDLPVAARPGWSVVTRLTTPGAVPSARPGPSASSGTIVSGSSPAGRST